MMTYNSLEFRLVGTYLKRSEIALLNYTRLSSLLIREETKIIIFIQHRWSLNVWCGIIGDFMMKNLSDLTPLDFFLWGYLKDKVMFEPPTTKENMKQRIRNAYASVT